MTKTEAKELEKKLRQIELLIRETMQIATYAQPKMLHDLQYSLEGVESAAGFLLSKPDLME